jgi:hypothetical protein
MNSNPAGLTPVGRSITASTHSGFIASVNSANPQMVFRRVASSRSPEEVMVYGNIADRFRVLFPIKVRIDIEDDGTCIASDEIFEVYGQGSNRDAAIADYKSSLVEYYQFMESLAKDHEPTATMFRRLGTMIARSSNLNPD